MTNKIVQTSVADADLLSKKKVPLINLFSFTGKNAEKLEKTCLLWGLYSNFQNLACDERIEA